MVINETNSQNRNLFLIQLIILYKKVSSGETEIAKLSSLTSLNISWNSIRAARAAVIADSQIPNFIIDQ